MLSCDIVLQKTGLEPTLERWEPTHTRSSCFLASRCSQCIESLCALFGEDLFPQGPTIARGRFAQSLQRLQSTIKRTLGAQSMINSSAHPTPWSTSAYARQGVLSAPCVIARSHRAPRDLPQRGDEFDV